MKIATVKPTGKIGRAIAAAVMLAGISACATPPTDPEALKAYNEANDPLEPFNRAMFGLNNTIDAIAIKPTASAYRNVVPVFMQDMVTNFLTNLKQPVVALNSLLQGDPQAMGDSLGRFVFNSIAGAGGFFDPASDAGVPKHEEDFGQTLAVWGVGEGAYLVLPLLGPTTVRDGTGRVVDHVVDPINYAIRHGMDEEDLVLARAGAEALDFRQRNLDELDRLEETSIDFYATIRSIYRQQRRQLINNEDVDLEDPAFTNESDVSGDADLYDDPDDLDTDEVSAADEDQVAG